MCGIFGFVATHPRDAADVLDGLRFLEYRGYDSWGIAVAREGKVTSEKAIGPIAEADVTLPPATAALGHTRWATHGAVTAANAHPHVDCSGRFALIHNGIVENYRNLGQQLRRPHRFRSQTDTEVLVHLIEESLEDSEDLLEALRRVIRRVEGLSAVAVLDGQTGQIAVAKNGSPLALGWCRDAWFLASDPMALLDHTREVAFLEDGQSAVLDAQGIRVHDLRTGTVLQPEIRTISWDSRRAGLNGYSHFMLKEIHEQPRMLREIAEHKGRHASALADMIRAAKEVYLVGCGTAHHAAMSGRYLLAQTARRASTAAVASEMSVIAPFLGPDSLVIALSQSGETIDVLEAVRLARDRGARVAAIVNAEGSSLDRFSDLSVLLGAGPERCVLATKSYTAMVAVMQLTAEALAGSLASGLEAVREASRRVEALLDRESLDCAIRATASRIADHQHLFVLGRHRCYPLALEIALKVKEVSYMHAEGFAAGELKHGVIALITNGTPCLVLAPDDNFRREALAAAAEVRARGALTIGLSAMQEAEFDQTLPVSGTESAPYEIAAASQLLAYELAVLRGCDPDRPRNLAKSVTVK
jgi:glutamine---fructose-6-phosphate transaminase (isomerizing)